jgi:hypothetical protein
MAAFNTKPVTVETKATESEQVKEIFDNAQNKVPESATLKRESEAVDPSQEAFNDVFASVINEGIMRGVQFKLNEASKYVSGEYNLTDRTVSLFVSSVVKPSRQDAVTALHEMVHDTMTGLDPVTRAAIHRGLDNLGETRLTAEERLTEAFAQQGVDREVSKGLAANIIRQFIDLLTRAAMYVQEKMLGKDFTGGFLANLYARNMTDSIIGNDSQYGDFSRNFKPIPLHATFDAISHEGRVMVTDNGLVYPRARGLETNARMTNITVDKLTSFRLDAQAQANRRSALLELGINDDVLYRTSPELKAKKDVEQRIANTQKAIAALNERKVTLTALFNSYAANVAKYTTDEIEALRTEGKLVANYPDLNAFMHAFGLGAHPDFEIAAYMEHITEQIKQDLGAKIDIATLVNPAARMDDLPELLRPEVALLTREQITNDVQHVREKMNEAKVVSENSFNESNQLARDIKAFDKNLLDLKTTERVIKRKLLEYIGQIVRDLPRAEQVGRAHSLAVATATAFANRPEQLNQYVPKLLEHINLDQGSILGSMKRLYELDRAGTISLKNGSIESIRDAMNAAIKADPSHPFATLSDPIKVGLLTFAKDQVLLSAIVERQMIRSQKDITQLNRLRDLYKNRTSDALTEVKELLKSTETKMPSATEIASWLDHRKTALTKQGELVRAEHLLHFGPAIENALNTYRGRLSQRIGNVHVIYSVAEGAELPLPSDATSGLWDTREKYTAEETPKFVRALDTWLEARENDPNAQNEDYFSAKDLRDRLLKFGFVRTDKYAQRTKILSGKLHGFATFFRSSATRAGEQVASMCTSADQNITTTRNRMSRLGNITEAPGEELYRRMKISGGDAHTKYFVPAIVYMEAAKLHGLDETITWNEYKKTITDENLLKHWELFKTWIQTCAHEGNVGIRKLHEDLGLSVKDDSLIVYNAQTGREEVGYRKEIERGMKDYTFMRSLSDEAKSYITKLNDYLISDGEKSLHTRDWINGIDSKVDEDNLATSKNNLKGTFAVKQVLDPSGNLVPVPAGVKPSVFLKSLSADKAYTDGATKAAVDSVNSGSLGRIQNRFQLLQSSDFWTHLVRPLFVDNINTTLPSPNRADGLSLTASSALVSEIAATTSDIAAIAKHIHENSTTTESLEHYTARVYQWTETMLKRLNNNVNPKENANVALESTPHVMMDAREVSTYPAAWVDYAPYTPENMMSLGLSLSVNASFGRDFSDLIQKTTEMGREVSLLAADYTGRDAKSLREWKRKDRKAFELARGAVSLKAQYGSTGEHARDMIYQAFDPKKSSIYDMGLALRLWQNSIVWMLTGFSSAVKNLSSPINRFVTTKTVGIDAWVDMINTYKNLGQEAIASLVNVVGSVWNPGAVDRDLLVKSGSMPVTGINTLKQLVQGSRGPDFALDQKISGGGWDAFSGRAEQTLQKISSVVSGLKLSLSDATKGPVALANMFTWANTAASVAMYRTELYRIRKWAARLAADPTNYPKTEHFKNLNSAYLQEGIILERMAEQINKGRDPFDADLARKVWNFVNSTFSSERGINNRPVAAQTSPIIRQSFTLLGYPWHQTMRILDMYQTADGKKGLTELLKGISILALTAVPSTVAFSMMLDEWDEHVRGKKNMTRPFNDDLTNNLLSVLERNTYVAPMGYASSLPNALLNPAAAITLNTPSLDNSIVWAGQLKNFGTSVRNLVTTGENANWANVYRQLSGVFGMTGPIQNVQILGNVAENWLGIQSKELPLIGALADAENKITNRTNVFNWLRAAGNQTGREIRSVGGESYSITPLTPIITDMVLAAMDNDPEAFQSNLRKAFKVASDLKGPTKAMDYIKESFARRNPLKSVFATPPMDYEYQQMLNILPDNGRQSVTEAVNLFNQYGAMLSITPFYGTVKMSKERQYKMLREQSDY